MQLTHPGPREEFPESRFSVGGLEKLWPDASVFPYASPALRDPPAAVTRFHVTILAGAGPRKRRERPAAAGLCDYVRGIWELAPNLMMVPALAGGQLGLGGGRARPQCWLAGIYPCWVAGGARVYHYVGPAEVLAAARPLAPARVVLAREDIPDAKEPFTFVIDLAGTLRLAPRRSEHVACAGGMPVLSAGEIAFGRGPDGPEVASATNQSTGYCPEPSSWPAVAAALDRIAVPHPGGFTDEFTFRRCPGCGERNLVRDGDFTCAICDTELPTAWNFGSMGQRGQLAPASERARSALHGRFRYWAWLSPRGASPAGGVRWTMSG